MEYNKELYELSSVLENSKEYIQNDEIRNLEIALLNIVIPKFRVDNGLAKMVLTELDEGFSIVETLQRLQGLDILVKDYLIYITEEQGHLTCYELTWDYQNYYSFMKYHELIDGFEAIPLDYKAIFLRDTLKTLNVCREAQKEIERRRKK